MVSRRRIIVALAAGTLPPPATLAQQPGALRRVGFLATRSRSTSANPDVHYEAFVQGMRKLGYVDGNNLVIEWRFAEGKFERLPDLADALVRMNVEVIVTHGTTATHAAQRATTTIPIVTAAVNEPIASGFAASLARPGGNITGLSVISADVVPKQLELLKTMMRGLSRVAVLVNPGNPAHSAVLKSVEAASRQFGIHVGSISARTAEDIERGFDLAKRERVEAVIVAADTEFMGQGRQIAELAMRNLLATMTQFREQVAAGCLMSYGQDVADFFRRAATYVDKILRGAKPGDLPIEQPALIYLAINRRTARALGLTIPSELLLSVDEVIE